MSSPTLDPAIVDATNALTARWAARATSGSTVLAGSGVWPLLGILAAGAAGDTRAELAEALGVDTVGAADAAGALLELWRRTDGARAACGLWTQPWLTLAPGWVAGLPQGTHGMLTGNAATDQPLLDDWVRTHTDGLLRRMPVDVDRSIVLVLATALVVRLRWQRVFEDRALRPEAGPWADGPELAGLTRSTDDLDDIGVLDSAAGPITRVRITGQADVDVHLVLGGPDTAPGAVLSESVAAVRRPAAITGGAMTTGGAGPGIAVGTAPGFAETLSLACVRFTVSATHDLLRDADLFGLSRAADDLRAEFPGIGADRLVVARAAQEATATLSATGFEAAAVTSVLMGSSAAAQRSARQVRVTIDRPHGFLAVHRPTGLVMVAGWVGEATTAADLAGQ